jgi:hypothetical protein
MESAVEQIRSTAAERLRELRPAVEEAEQLRSTSL